MQFKPQVEKLASGLTLVSVPMQTESLTILVLIHAGSREELEGQWGAAHFLEHFVFKGTKKYPKVNDVTKVIDEIGGKMNAFTWTDLTGFWVKVAAEQWQRGLRVVGQLVSEPLLPEKEIKKERGTIIEEIKMYEDNHQSKAVNELEDMLFPNSSLGRQVIGTVESVGAMRIEDLKDFRDAWYFPENIVLVVAGKLPQVGEWRKAVEEELGSIKAKREKVQRFDYNRVFVQDQPRVKLTTRKTEQAHLAMGVRAYGAADEKNYTLWVLNQLLGANMSSRLWNEVREKRGLAYYVRSGFHSHLDQGVAMIRAGVRLNKVEQAIRVIMGELDKLTVKKVGGKELKMAKEGVKGGLKLDLEDSQEVAEMLAMDWALLEGKMRLPEEMVKRIEEVTAEDVREVAQELFKGSRMNLSIVGPVKGEERLEKILRS